MIELHWVSTLLMLSKVSCNDHLRFVFFTLSYREPQMLVGMPLYLPEGYVYGYSCVSWSHDPRHWVRGNKAWGKWVLVRSCSGCRCCHHDHQEASGNMEMTSPLLQRSDLHTLTGFGPICIHTFCLICTSFFIHQGIKFHAIVFILLQ